ncbi:ZYBA0S05-04434g1_1 [Zygosaccharomyces bailii CLIB 213]|uniref:IMP-specific 5'-nucleotidase 1 n=1 Tax=Zygosaccharomyces bailii (strain CLIB 213 / ATCC 58445 / CBS 680 / BCRC 21525 / NBRC 1098 / NCYC 1416 / NRRL Y-2227) TaxID=1333698 RepID=A0A8J2T9J7_ZYGB2|nr:ZYBA0S05-04434g1_1 [Zygosaccharomyces bailii CLIB 213]
MSSRYRVEYHLKSHRKDGFVDWIKGLLAAPFVLHAVSQDLEDWTTSQRVRSQYAQIFKDIEVLIDNKMDFDARSQELEKSGAGELEYELLGKSRLKQLVPTIGSFFTELPLEKAFLWGDSHGAISDRRMVAPSFNDVRRILNTAQVFYFKDNKRRLNRELLKLVTFDGDVTLYEDGGSLTFSNPVIPYLLTLLERNIRVGIVTAAGYDEPQKYESRLEGLITAVHDSTSLTQTQKRNLAIMGGESNYLFQYYEEGTSEYGFKTVPQEEWLLPHMKDWEDRDIQQTLDFAEKMLYSLKKRLNLPEEVPIIRKERAVGIVSGERFDPIIQRQVRVGLQREQLEEIVLTLQSSLETFLPARRIQFSCFDGGSDVWCDIGGKDLGLRILQRFYQPSDPIKASETLHVGDQFAPIGSANDFKARLAGCTLWIASPAETVVNLHKLVSD